MTTKLSGVWEYREGRATGFYWGFTAGIVVACGVLFATVRIASASTLPFLIPGAVAAQAQGPERINPGNLDDLDPMVAHPFWGPLFWSPWGVPAGWWWV